MIMQQLTRVLYVDAIEPGGNAVTFAEFGREG